MYHITPALEFIRQEQQRSMLDRLCDPNKKKILGISDLDQRIAKMHGLMSVAVDMYSMILLRKEYNEFMEEPDNQKAISAFKAIRNTEYKHRLALNKEMSVNQRVEAVSHARYEMPERFDPKTFRGFWYNLTFNFLDRVKADEQREFFRTLLFNPPYSPRNLAREVNSVFRMRALKINKALMEMPEHVRGMLLVRSNRVI